MSALGRLAAERAALLSRAHAERATIAHSLAPLARPLGVLDQAWGGARWLGQQLAQRPLAVGTALVVAAAMRPRRALRLLRIGVSAWQLWRWAREALR